MEFVKKLDCLPIKNILDTIAYIISSKLPTEWKVNTCLISQNIYSIAEKHLKNIQDAIAILQAVKKRKVISLLQVQFGNSLDKHPGVSINLDKHEMVLFNFYHLIYCLIDNPSDNVLYGVSNKDWKKYMDSNYKRLLESAEKVPSKISFKRSTSDSKPNVNYSYRNIQCLMHYQKQLLVRNLQSRRRRVRK